MSSEARELARRIVDDVAASYSVSTSMAPAAEPRTDAANDQDAEPVESPSAPAASGPEPAAPASPARAAARRIVDEVFAAGPVTAPGDTAVTAPTGDERPADRDAAEVPAASDQAIDEAPSDRDAAEAPAVSDQAIDDAPPGRASDEPIKRVTDDVVDVTSEAVVETPAVVESPAVADPAPGDPATDAGPRPDPTDVAARIVEDVLAKQRAAADAQTESSVAAVELTDAVPGGRPGAAFAESSGADPEPQPAATPEREAGKAAAPEAEGPVVMEATVAPSDLGLDAEPAAPPKVEGDAAEPSWLDVSDEPAEHTHEDGPPPVPSEALTASGTETDPEVRPLDQEPTVALEFEEPSRAGRWLLMTVIGALGLAVLFPLAVAAIRQFLSMY